MWKPYNDETPRNVQLLMKDTANNDIYLGVFDDNDVCQGKHVKIPNVSLFGRSHRMVWRHIPIEGYISDRQIEMQDI